MLVSGLCFEVLIINTLRRLKLYRKPCAFEDLKTFNDAQLRDIGLRRQDVDVFDQDQCLRELTDRSRYP